MLEKNNIKLDNPPNIPTNNSIYINLLNMMKRKKNYKKTKLFLKKQK